jgi:hypothetical protein
MCELCPEAIDPTTLTRGGRGHALDNLCTVKEGGIRKGNIVKASPRVEPLQCPRRDVGVRGLKAFRAGEIMTEYVGGTYPEHVIKKDGKSRVSLYLNNDGVINPTKLWRIVLKREGNRRVRTTNPRA